MGSRLTATEEARRLRVYLKAANDLQAAKTAKLGTMTWRLWRQSRGLPPPGQEVSPAARQMVEGLLGLHDSKLLASTIERLEDAEVRGTFVSRGLQITDKEDRRRRAAYDRYPHDVAAARALKLPRSTFRLWRQARGLPPKNPQSGLGVGHRRPPTAAAVTDLLVA